MNKPRIKAVLLLTAKTSGKIIRRQPKSGNEYKPTRVSHYKYAMR